MTAASATTLSSELNPQVQVPSDLPWRAYWTEAKYEVIRACRAPAFAIPFFSLPVVFYVLVGIFLVGSMSHGDPRVIPTMFVNWATFGVMGPGMFGFGMFVATEREQGLLRLKRALPMPTASYVLAKMAMTMIFGAAVMATLILAAVFLAHARITLMQYLLITVIDVVGSLSFCAIGLFIGSRASAKSAPAFVNLAYLPMMHLAGLFYPLPKSIQPLEFISPAFYLNQLNLHVARAASIDALALASGPSSHARPLLCIAVLTIVTLCFGILAARRLKRLG
ncbi:MAG: ABC transporter permease [Acidobacteria bacterium]|nr:ABC transporter permease [Acidobacteriota bacterium]